MLSMPPCVIGSAVYSRGKLKALFGKI